MAKFNTHLMIGIIIAISYTVIQVLLTGWDYIKLPFDFLIGLFGIPLFALIPDIDQAASKSRKIFLMLAFFTIIILAILQEYIIIVGLCVAFLFVLYTSKHRGFFHSLWFGLIVSGFFIFYNFMFALAAYVSYMSHLWLDSYTKNNKFPY